MKKLTLAAAGLLMIAFAGAGKISMPHVFTDNMVLQADTVAAIWGRATPGARVTASGSWGASASAKADSEGRWRLGLRTPEASYEPLSLTVSDGADKDAVTLNNVLAGEVWICSGQSNMEMVLDGFRNQPVEGAGEEITFARRLGRGIRFVKVPRNGSYEPQEDFDGQWQECLPHTIGRLSALAWFYGQALRDILDRPVGLVTNAYGGTPVEGYVPVEIASAYPDINIGYEKRPDTEISEWHKASKFYYAMVLPVAGYTARGFLWNQGETNVYRRHTDYPGRQADMLREWRRLWRNDDMPFYFVEIPAWEYSGVDNTEAAYFREQQHLAADSTHNAWIVSTADLARADEPDDIHPRNKRPIGNRLAALAATYTYNIKGIPHTFPRYRSWRKDGDGAAVVYFDNADTGFTPNENLCGFEVAGADRVFRPAKAEISRERGAIRVTSDDVADIRAVRYLFRNFYIGRVHDLHGMPVMPFRTDDWPAK